MEFIDFGAYNTALLILCPLGSIIGSLAHAIVITISLDSLPNEEGKIYFASKDLQKARSLWLFLRLGLGAILGLVLGLYFIGAIQETPSTLAKVVALSILAGYVAPKVWLAQDEIFALQLERFLKSKFVKNDLNVLNNLTEHNTDN
jgi:hypothetical protein